MWWFGSFNRKGLPSRRHRKPCKFPKSSQKPAYHKSCQRGRARRHCPDPTSASTVKATNRGTTDCFTDIEETQNSSTWSLLPDGPFTVEERCFGECKRSRNVSVRSSEEFDFRFSNWLGNIRGRSRNSSISKPQEVMYRPSKLYKCCSLQECAQFDQRWKPVQQTDRWAARLWQCGFSWKCPPGHGGNGCLQEMSPDCWCFTQMPHCVCQEMGDLEAFFYQMMYNAI